MIFRIIIKKTGRSRVKTTPQKINRRIATTCHRKQVWISRRFSVSTNILSHDINFLSVRINSYITRIKYCFFQNHPKRIISNNYILPKSQTHPYQISLQPGLQKVSQIALIIPNIVDWFIISKCVIKKSTKYSVANPAWNRREDEKKFVNVVLI